MFAYLRRITFPILLCIAFKSPGFAGEMIEGFTEPYRTVDISAGEPGVVTQVQVQPGQFVEAGDLLVALDTSVLEATLAVAKQKASATGSLEAAQAEFDLRKERFEQIALLRQRGHATTREFSRAETDLLIAQARFKLAQEEQQLTANESRRRFCAGRSPVPFPASFRKCIVKSANHCW